MNDVRAKNILALFLYVIKDIVHLMAAEPLENKECDMSELNGN